MRTVKLIPALDTLDLAEAVRIVRAVDGVPGVYGYKVGFALGLTHGLPRVVEEIRKTSSKPVIYDHQKAGTDIPDTGELYAKTMRGAGIDEVIVFPHAGPRTLAAWIVALQAERLKVIVGGIMTHPSYLASEGGFLLDDGILGAYKEAASLGVKSFVVPLTKPALVRAVVERIGENKEWEFYSPGLGKQGGTMSAFGFLERHYVIVGRSLLAAPDPQAYLEKTLKEAAS
jgi:orotidine-5'-phosphate decarboxylase